MEFLQLTTGRPRRVLGRLLATAILLLIALASLPLSAAAGPIDALPAASAVAAAQTPAVTQPSTPASTPEGAAAVVPAPFNANMTWSQEGTWHWVTMSFSGVNSTTGIWLPQAYFVASMVRSFGPNDACTNCVPMSDNQQGPPIVLGGPQDPQLSAAYHNLDNGARTRGTNGVWAAGSWYLNFSPRSQTFFSWTWIPDSSTAVPVAGAAAMPSLLTTNAVGGGTRVFPLAGNYTETQGYGCVSYNGGYAQVSTCPANAPSFHDGVDLAAPVGTPIVAAAAGTVTFAGLDSNQPGANSMILIQHDGANAGYTTEYLHWQQSFVKVGDRVVAGQQIAAVGSVGYSTGPHLHFAVKDASGGTIDPLGWLKGATVPIAGGQGGSVASGVLQWLPLIQAAADQTHVPAAFIAAIMTVESSGNPGSISPVGAQGLMQIMPDQLTRLGVAQAQWLDPAANIDAGARYIAETLSNGGTLEQAAASYFGQGCDVFGTCTDQYVARIIAWEGYYAAVFSGQQAMPPTVIPAPVYSGPTPTVDVAPVTPAVAAAAAPTPAVSAATTPAPAPAPDPTATPTSTATPSPTVTAAATPAPSPAAAPTTAPTATAAPTPTAAPTATPAPTAQPTPSPTATATPSPTPSPTPTATPTSQVVTPSATPQSPQAVPNGTSTSQPDSSGTTSSTQQQQPTFIVPTISPPVPRP